jgi:N-acetylmuramoyl-L-alanine amidase
MKVCLILDVAHGINVAGKRSPDGVFLEYLWSREMCSRIQKSFQYGNYSFDIRCPFLDNELEPGLRNRVKEYEAISENYDKTIMLSLHVDAFGNGARWYDKITGFSFWTSRGETWADDIATFIGESFRNKYFRDERMRFAYWLNKGEKDKDLDWESDFTVLVSDKYDGVLIEHLFQTNKIDVYQKLMNEEWKQILVDLYHSTIIDLMNKILNEQL